MFPKISVWWDLIIMETKVTTFDMSPFTEHTKQENLVEKCGKSGQNCEREILTSSVANSIRKMLPGLEKFECKFRRNTDAPTASLDKSTETKSSLIYGYNRSNKVNDQNGTDAKVFSFQERCDNLEINEIEVTTDGLKVLENTCDCMEMSMEDRDLCSNTRGENALCSAPQNTDICFINRLKFCRTKEQCSDNEWTCNRVDQDSSTARRQNGVSDLVPNKQRLTSGSSVTGRCVVYHIYLTLLGMLMLSQGIG